MVELSPAWKTRFSSEILDVENGSLDEMERGKKDLSGNLSLMSGIGITVPFFNIDSRKKIPVVWDLWSAVAVGGGQLRTEGWEARGEGVVVVGDSTALDGDALDRRNIGLVWLFPVGLFQYRIR